MKIKNIIFALAIFFTTTSFAMNSKSLIGVVNFMNCLTDSKYGKNEQEQLENIKKQWTQLIEQTDKDLKDINSKLEDEDYIGGLSPQAIEELNVKQKALSEDIMKYQNQLYQILNQANYFFMQKMSNNISVASEKIADKKNLDLVLNKEACFYTNPKLDITSLVIKEMDLNFDKETAQTEKEKNENATAKTEDQPSVETAQDQPSVETAQKK
jgi:Skp family chaperone for outer membrane proteins